MIALLLTLTALAADPVTNVQRLVERGDFRGAIKRCDNLDAQSGQNEALREACASAHMSLLGDAGDAAAWSAIAQNWSGTSVADMARERAAEMALEQLGESATEAQLLRIETRYPGSAAAARARSRSADAALAAAIEANEVMTYRAFREKFKGTSQADQALQKEAEAALADVEQYDTPVAWKRLRSHYPQLAATAEAREVQALGRIISETAKLEIPCPIPDASGPDDAPPPQCTTLPKDSEIKVTWTTPEGYTAKARLVGWDGEKSIDLSALQRKIGPAPYASPYAEITVAAKGTSTEEGWSMVMPVDLKRPPDMNFRGYAVQIRVLGLESTFLPFVVSETWKDARRRR